MSFEELMKLSFTGSELDYAVSVVLWIAAISIGAFIICECFFGFVFWLAELIQEKLIAKRLHIRREDDQSYMGSLPLRDCPCCETPPLAKLVNKRLKIGYIYCPGCQMRTEQAVMYKAAMVWNSRPRSVDVLGEGDYKQIFELDQKCSK